MKENVSSQFDKLPKTENQRETDGRPTRKKIIKWWKKKYGVNKEIFHNYSFWEKGKGKIWIFRDTKIDSPIENMESIGLLFMRTKRKYWKPTTEAIQKFGKYATKNIIELEFERASEFISGKNQTLKNSDIDQGYVIVTHRKINQKEPIGVGLYIDQELRSQIPKARQREI